MAPKATLTERLPVSKLPAVSEPPSTLTPIASRGTLLRVNVVLAPSFWRVPLPKIEPVNVPELAVNFAKLESVTVPAERVPTANCAPVRFREPPVRLPNEPMDVAVACPPFTVPRITKLAALTEPPDKVVSCRRPIFAPMTPSLITALLMVALLAKVVVPGPLRLPKVMVPLLALKLEIPELESVPKVNPPPDTERRPKALTLINALA